MKKTVLYLCLTFFFMGLVNAQTRESKIPRFRQIDWGTHYSDIEKDKGLEFKVVKKTDKEIIRTAKNDNLKVGSVKLKNIFYVFNEEDKLYKVVLTGKNKYIDDLEFILEYKYGEHDQLNSFDMVDYKKWNVRGVTYNLSDWADTNEFRLEIKSNWRAMEAYNKNTKVDDF